MWYSGSLNGLLKNALLYSIRIAIKSLNSFVSAGGEPWIAPGDPALAGEPGVTWRNWTGPRRGPISRIYLGNIPRLVIRPLRGREPWPNLTPGSLRSPGAIQGGPPSVTVEHDERVYESYFSETRSIIWFQKQSWIPAVSSCSKMPCLPWFLLQFISIFIEISNMSVSSNSLIKKIFPFYLHSLS